jgi:ribosome-binding ATPase YchF (GTP1/OBG family)
VLYVCNVDESSASEPTYSCRSRVKEAVAARKCAGARLAVGLEADIAELESMKSSSCFLEDVGLDEPGSAKLIRKAYELLSLETYFTAGRKR